MTVRCPPPLRLSRNPISITSIPLSRIIATFLLALLFLLLSSKTAWSQDDSHPARAKAVENLTNRMIFLGERRLAAAQALQASPAETSCRWRKTAGTCSRR